jgi:hypothetical protein
MAFEPGEFPEFSWSQSRRGTFQECPRKYYWQYYGSWKGWEADAPAEAQLAYRLKKITNVHLFVGGLVHDLAARAILDARGGKSPRSAGALIEEGKRRLNQAYLESQKKAQWEKRPKWLTMFHEFYYGKGPSGTVIERIKEKFTSCVQNLLASQSYREALQAPFVEVWSVDQEMTTFQLGGHTIYAQPDLLYRMGDGEYRIVDWKTGEEGELHAGQLRIYGLYVRSRLDLKRGPLTGVLEYLQTGQQETKSIDDNDLKEQEREVLDSIGMMQRYLADATTNQCLPKEAFPLSTDLNRCRYCNFYELNREEIEKAGPKGPFS